MKALLELHMPESCKECSLSFHYKSRLSKGENCLHCVPKSLIVDDYVSERAPFCPLQSVSEEV